MAAHEFKVKGEVKVNANGKIATIALVTEGHPVVLGTRPPQASADVVMKRPTITELRRLLEDGDLVVHASRLSSQVTFFFPLFFRCPPSTTPLVGCPKRGPPRGGGT